MFTGTFVCGFEVLGTLLVLNFANPKTFMTVSSRLKFFTGIKFCGLGYNSEKSKN